MFVVGVIKVSFLFFFSSFISFPIKTIRRFEQLPQLLNKPTAILKYFFVATGVKNYLLMKADVNISHPCSQRLDLSVSLSPVLIGAGPPGRALPRVPGGGAAPLPWQQRRPRCGGRVAAGSMASLAEPPGSRAHSRSPARSPGLSPALGPSRCGGERRRAASDAVQVSSPEPGPARTLSCVRVSFAVGIRWRLHI